MDVHLHYRDAATAEHHAASLEGQLAELHEQPAAAQQRAEEAEAQLAELRAAHEALQQEFALVADDLTVMVRENQVHCGVAEPHDAAHRTWSESTMWLPSTTCH
jgi:chromosome segregation ATPase